MDYGRLAAAVGDVCRGSRSRVLEVWKRPAQKEERKKDGTVVTALDHELEENLFEALERIEPGLGFVGEERGERRTGQPAWHVDPLDGTLNFSRRMSLFAMQAVLLDGHRPLVAIVYDPVFDRLVTATEGGGTWQDGERVHVSDRGMDEILLLTNISRSGRFVADPETLPRVRRFVSHIRAFGTVAVHMRDVACGLAEAYVASRGWPSQPYDFAPGVLLIREAGGVVTSLDGADPFEDARSILAAPPALHAALLDLFQEP